MKKVLYMLVAGGLLMFSSCDAPGEERTDVLDEREDLAEERAEGDVDDIAEEREELKEEIEEYNEAVAEEVDTTVVIH